MATDKKRAPEFFTDSSGAELARLPLAASGTFAVLHASDMKTLIDAGVSQNWSTNHHGYVVVNIPKRGPVPVARLVIGASDGECVSYKDGDRRNLRHDNLSLARNNTVRVDIEALRALQAAERQARAAYWAETAGKSSQA